MPQNKAVASGMKSRQHDRDVHNLMRSLRAIRAVNEEIAAKAAQKNRVPFVPDGPEDTDRWPPFPFPGLGYHEPPGWETTDHNWFVDKTGRGTEIEPALTVQRFRAELRRYITENPGHGFAITEEGEFQAVVSAFRRAMRDALE